MKIILFFLITISGISATAQTKIKIEDVSKHVGDSVTVCSKVYGTKFLDQSASQITFINLGAAYPNSLLTVIVFGKDRPVFPSAPEVMYADKEMCVSGVIKLERERFEIVATKPAEILVK